MEPEEDIEVNEEEVDVKGSDLPVRYQKLQWNSESLIRPKRSNHPNHPINQITSLCKLVTASLGLLCVLLLTAVISVSVHYAGHRASCENLTRERDQLQTGYDQLRTSYDQLQSSRDRLQTSYDQLVSEQQQQQLPSASGGCPHEWKRFENNCYVTSLEEYGTWRESRQSCMENGADLVIINSVEEQDFVNTLGLENFWIGLTDIDNEGTWKWVDGSIPTITFWRTDEPNDANEGEDCAVFNTPRWNGRSWNDQYCSAPNLNRWVCESAYKVP